MYEIIKAAHDHGLYITIWGPSRSDNTVCVLDLTRDIGGKDFVLSFNIDDITKPGFNSRIIWFIENFDKYEGESWQILYKEDESDEQTKEIG